MPLLFEVRYAYELHRAGVTAEYEYSAGIGKSSVDFRLAGTPEWLIECVSIRASKGAKRAMRQRGEIYEQHFTSRHPDPHQTPEGEMVRAGELIAEKVLSRGRPTKFPTPSPQRYHVIVVDTRGYLDGGGDAIDFRQITYGWRGVPEDREWMIHWFGPLGEEQPVRGLFEAGNPVRGAEMMRSRIHFLHFVQEEEYTEGEIVRRGYMLANPWLVEDYETARQIVRGYPLVRQPETGAPS
ncbi:MAG TPA: hypothetical protein VFR37_00330 [Longimicrobium sp.]|nr:hypothetical protein [Longimicrobium sp.]